MFSFSLPAEQVMFLIATIRSYHMLAEHLHLAWNHKTVGSEKTSSHWTPEAFTQIYMTFPTTFPQLGISNDDIIE